jgi:hypothetical protein
MSTVAVYSKTHSVTYVADNILKSLKDIIRLSGLDPSEFVGDWQTNMRAVRTWLESGHLNRIMLEIYNPKTDALIERWDIDVAYGGAGGDGSFWLDTEQLKYAIRKAGVAPSEARYCLKIDTKEGRPDVAGWSRGQCRSTSGMVRQSLGATIEHGALSASTSYLRRV